MKDAEIIEGIKRGDYSRCAKSLYSYFPVVKKYVIKNSGNREDAEDVFQDALMILFKKVNDGNFALSAALNTYIFGIARNLWHERLRSMNKKLVVNDLPDGNTGEEMTSALEEDAKVRRAYEAVALLGQKCRELLGLFYFKKRSMVQIAAELGFGSEQLAKNQKYRCIEKAKQIYSTLN